MAFFTVLKYLTDFVDMQKCNLSVFFDFLCIMFILQNGIRLKIISWVLVFVCFANPYPFFLTLFSLVSCKELTEVTNHFYESISFTL